LEGFLKLRPGTDGFTADSIILELTDNLILMLLGKVLEFVLLEVNALIFGLFLTGYPIINNCFYG